MAVHHIAKKCAQAKTGQRVPSEVAGNACRFLYERVLHRQVEALRQALPFTRKPVLRPQVYSAAELERLFTVGTPHPKQRAFLMTVYGAGLRLNDRTPARVLSVLPAARVGALGGVVPPRAVAAFDSS